MTVPGPFTMSQQAQNDHCASEAELAKDQERDDGNQAEGQRATNVQDLFRHGYHVATGARRAGATT